MGRVSISPRATPSQKVQTHTNLPPGIDGRLYAHLCLQISLFRWTSSHPLQSIGDLKSPPSNPISIHVVWWGEEGHGSVFYPRLAHKAGHKQNYTKTTAIYPVCVPVLQFYAYLSDMKSLFLDIVDDSCHATIGRGRVEKLCGLAIDSPIISVIAVASATGAKFGELSVSLSVEPNHVAVSGGRSLYVTGCRSALLRQPQRNVVIDRTSPLPKRVETLEERSKPAMKTVTLGKVSLQLPADNESSNTTTDPKSEVDFASTSHDGNDNLKAPMSESEVMRKENAIDPQDGDLSLSPYAATYQPPAHTAESQIDRIAPAAIGDDSEILRKIHCALKESRRLREQVMFSEMDSEVAAAVASVGFQASSPRANSIQQTCSSPRSFALNDPDETGGNNFRATSDDPFMSTMFPKVQPPDTNGLKAAAHQVDEAHNTNAKLGGLICALGGDRGLTGELFDVDMDVTSLEDDEIRYPPGSDLDEIEGLNDIAQDDSLLNELFFSAEQKNFSSSNFNGNMSSPEDIVYYVNGDSLAGISKHASLASSKRPATGVVPRKAADFTTCGTRDQLFGVEVTFRRCSIPANAWIVINCMLHEERNNFCGQKLADENAPVNEKKRTSTENFKSSTFLSSNLRRSYSMPLARLNYPHGRRRRPSTSSMKLKRGGRSCGFRSSSASGSGGRVNGALRKSVTSTIVETMESVTLPETKVRFDLELLIPASAQCVEVGRTSPTNNGDWYTHCIPLRQGALRNPTNKLRVPACSTVAHASFPIGRPQTDNEPIILVSSKSSDSHLMKPIRISSSAVERNRDLRLRMRLFCSQDSCSHGEALQCNLEDSNKLCKFEATTIPNDWIKFIKVEDTLCPIRWRQPLTFCNTDTSARATVVLTEVISMLRCCGVMTRFCYLSCANTKWPQGFAFTWLHKKMIYMMQIDYCLLGIVDIPCRLLLDSIFETVDRSQESETHYGSPKTLRIRFDFTQQVYRRLSELLAHIDVDLSGVSSDALLSCFIFVNVKPVWKPTNTGVGIANVSTEHVSNMAANEATVPMNQYKMHAGLSIDQLQRVETSLPAISLSPLNLDTLLSVREARELSSDLQHSYLVVRTPWCLEESAAPAPRGDKGAQRTKRFSSAVAWGGGTSPAYHLGLRNSATFTEERLARLEQSFISIEVWSKLTTGQSDELIGIVKVPTGSITHAYCGGGAKVPGQLQDDVRSSLLSSEWPLIVEDGWLGVTYPCSGQQHGSLRVRLAIGTGAQISRLMESDRNRKSTESEPFNCSASMDWNCLDFIRWPPGHLVNGTLNATADSAASISVEHALTITLRQLAHFNPRLSETLMREFGTKFPRNDCDCFVQYYLSQENQSVLTAPCRSSTRPLQVPFTDTTSSPSNSTVQQDERVNCTFMSFGVNNSVVNEVPDEQFYHQTFAHRFFLRLSDLSKRVHGSHLVDGNAFLAWLGKHTGENSNGSGISFELWLRLFSPRLQDLIVARGLLHWETLSNLFPKQPPGESFLQSTNTQTKFDWEKRSAHNLRLYDVTSGQLAARLQLGLSYTCKSFIINQHEQHTDLEVSTDSKKHLFVDGFQLRPSTSRTGVRMRVNLHKVSGLWPGLNDITSGIFSGHIRVHCLLLLPPAPAVHLELSQAKPPFPRLLSTTSSTPIHSSVAAHDLKTQLDVLLPLSWVVEGQNHSQFEKQYLTLAEALAYGSQAVQDRDIWLMGLVRKPCIVIQIDVWEEIKSRLQVINQRQKTFAWGMAYEDGVIPDLYPGFGHSLIASCRVPLSGLLASTSGASACRWYSLIRSQILRANQSVGLGGGIELSIQFVAADARQRVLTEVVSRANPRGLKLLENWGIILPQMTGESQMSDYVVDQDVGVWDAGIDEHGSKYKLFTIHVDAASLPAEDQLLTSDEISDCRQNGFSPYVFARTAFFDFNFQNTPLHSLPLMVASRNDGSSCVRFGDVLQFTALVCPRLRNYLCKTHVEVQVWAQWMHAENESNLLMDPQLKSLSSQGCCQFIPGFKDFPFFKPPPPRLIGVCQIPLYHMIYGNNTSSLFKQSINCNSVCLYGTADSFFWIPALSKSSGIERAKPMLVYPLLKQDTNDFHDAWLSVRIDMTGVNQQLVQRLDERYEALNDSFAGSCGILSWVPVVDYVLHKPEMEVREMKVSGIGRLLDPAITVFPVHIIIERASRLVPDENLSGLNGSEELPKLETFVTFMVASQPDQTVGDPQTTAVVSPGTGRVAVTQLVKDSTAPVWNYQRYALLPVTLLNSDAVGFKFDVWQKEYVAEDIQRDAASRPLLMKQPRHMGTATVDLSLLALPSSLTNRQPLKWRVGGGLQFVHGWYNLVDRQNQLRGQILVGVYPISENIDTTVAAPMKPIVNRELSVQESIVRVQREQSQSPVPNSTRPRNAHSPITRMRQLLEKRVFSESQQQERTGKGLKSLMDTSTDCQAGTLNMSLLLTKLSSQMSELDEINAKMKSRLSQQTYENGFETHSQRNSYLEEAYAGDRMTLFRQLRSPVQKQQSQSLPTPSPLVLKQSDRTSSGHSQEAVEPKSIDTWHADRPGKGVAKTSSTIGIHPAPSTIPPHRASILKESMETIPWNTEEPSKGVLAPSRRSLRVISPTQSYAMSRVESWAATTIPIAMGGDSLSQTDRSETQIEKPEFTTSRNNSKPAAATDWDAYPRDADEGSSFAGVDNPDRRNSTSELVSRNHSTTLQDASSLPSNAMDESAHKSNRFSRAWSEISIPISFNGCNASVQCSSSADSQAGAISNNNASVKEPSPSSSTINMTSAMASSQERETFSKQENQFRTGTHSSSSSISLPHSEVQFRVASPPTFPHLPDPVSPNEAGDFMDTLLQHKSNEGVSTSTTSSTFFYTRPLLQQLESAPDAAFFDPHKESVHKDSPGPSTANCSISTPVDRSVSYPVGDQQAFDASVTPIEEKRATVQIVQPIDGLAYRPSHESNKIKSLEHGATELPVFFPSLPEIFEGNSVISESDPSDFIKQANDSLPHYQLRGLRMAREAAEAVENLACEVKTEKKVRLWVRHLMEATLKTLIRWAQRHASMMWKVLQTTFHYFTEPDHSVLLMKIRPRTLMNKDPIRDRIYKNLSELVRRTTIDKDKQATGISALEPIGDSSHAPSIHLSAKALQRAAKIFDMKL